MSNWVFVHKGTLVPLEDRNVRFPPKLKFHMLVSHSLELLRPKFLSFARALEPLRSEPLPES